MVNMDGQGGAISPSAKSDSARRLQNNFYFPSLTPAPNGALLIGGSAPYDCCSGCGPDCYGTYYSQSASLKRQTVTLSTFIRPLQ